MKQYGKYEKKPKVKSILLQTYFTSLLSLVLSVSMFLGTSYAWFTSEVNNTGNEIYIGILDVDLQKQVGEEWVSLPNVSDETADVPRLFDGSIRWEPGYTAVETVKIVDKGDLAFNYELTFTDGKIDGKTEEELLAVAKWFDVWVFDHQNTNTKYAKPLAYADITAEASGWTKVGTLAEVLEGKTVFSGGMDEAAVTATTATEHTYTIALHMNGENAAENQQTELNALMGQKIELSVKLVATQRSSETDGFGSSIYDAGTVVTNKEQLVAALDAAEDGDTIVLTAGDYDFTEEDLVITKGITLQAADPENKPVFVLSASDGNGGINYGIEINSDNVTLKNLQLKSENNNDSGYAVYIDYIDSNGSAYYSDIMINGCEFYGFDHCITMHGNNVTIQNCVLDESAANDQGTIIYVWGTSGDLTIRDNTFVGNAQQKHGISFYKNPAESLNVSKVSGKILIEGNTFNNVYKGVVHESIAAEDYSNVSVEILNNTFAGCKYKYIAIDCGKFDSYIVEGNVFGTPASGTYLMDNKAGATVSANKNYWDGKVPVLTEMIENGSSNVTVNNYYSDADKTTLVEVTTN